MELQKALFLCLGEIEEPVVTRYHLGVMVDLLCREKSYKGETLKPLRKDVATEKGFARTLMALLDSGVLSPHPDFSETAFRVLGRKEEHAEDVACSVDPFCYVSHLSAMSYHGITNRIPTTLVVSSPPSGTWKEEAEKRMKKDLGDYYDDYCEAGMPLLARYKMEKVGRTPIHRVSSVHWGAYTNVRGRTLRVSSIGRTFLDMLRMPDLCGGMRHVMETFEEFARTYLQLITDEVDRHGAPIDKVRAGYILEEHMGLKNEKIESWVQFAQRGGSRKLDASAEYLPEWSEKWLISLNLS